MKKFVVTAVTIAVVLAFAPALFAGGGPDGAAVYKAKCAMCHGADGKGKTPLVKADIQAKSVDELAKFIAAGKPPKMPAYKGKLSDDEITAVATHVKNLK